jgi:hypothetical protein
MQEAMDKMKIDSISITARIFFIEFIVVFGFLLFVRSSTMGLAVLSMLFSPIIMLVFVFVSLNYAAKYKSKIIGLNLLLGVNIFLLAANLWQVHGIVN